MTNTPTPETKSTESPSNQPEPGFGWNPYSERTNARFAMIGFVALILIELFTGQGLISWLGLR